MLSLRNLPVLLLAATLFGSYAHGADSADLAWPKLERTHKPWTRWWWPGSAVDKPDLSRELKAISELGFGGVEITPIYGAKGAESRFIPYLSEHYVEMLGYTATEAKRLDLSVDMATGTGWPFGGPQVSREDAEQKIAIKEGKLAPFPSRFRVKRAAPGGEGWVINPYSTRALDHYLATFTKALSPLPPGSIHAQFHDSFEYTGNWADELPEKFHSMHSYSLEDHVEELSGKGDPDTIARLKSDYRETLGQLHFDYVKKWVDWAHNQGSITREQAHGAPANLLDLYAVADIPETEVFGANLFPIPGYRRDANEVSPNDPQPLVNRFASSAAHVAGRPLASSETFTWLREHFHEAPSEMKPEVDQLFLTGINHIFYHGTCYSPSDVDWPGWLFYASTQFNSRNSLWAELASLNTYVARSQSLLQSGSPDNDLLLYWPIYDDWHNPKEWQRAFSMHGKEWLTNSTTGATAQSLLNRGYSFDFVSDSQLRQAKTTKSAWATPGGAYRALVIPKTVHLPLETLEAILLRVKDGATAIFLEGLPTDVPGFGLLEVRRAAFKAKLDELHWTNDAKIGLRTAKLGNGRVLAGGNLESLLTEAKIRREPLADRGIGLLRRRTADGYLYFVANLSGKALDDWIPLAHVSRSAVLMDARSGQAGLAASRKTKDQTEVYLQLKPGESMFVKLLANRKAKGDAWAYLQAAGSPIPVAGEWKVSFTSGGPILPPAFSVTTLHSWTAEGGETERFAGTARYEIEFTLPATAKAYDWLLDLGDVRETARITLNGTLVDRLWSLPFATRVGSHLKTGKNVLILEVTNVSANRIRDLEKRHVAWKNFYEINFVNAHYQPFDAANWDLQLSGLLGPVTLVPLMHLNP